VFITVAASDQNSQKAGEQISAQKMQMTSESCGGAVQNKYHHY
jgi:hypothetical protein